MVLPPCSRAALTPKLPTGVVGDRPIRPVSAQSCRACTISSACQLSIATGASPTQPKTVGPTNSKKKPIVHSGSRGGQATSTNEKPSTDTIAALPNQSVRCVGHWKCPAPAICITRRRRAGSWSRRCRSRSRQSSPAKQWARRAREGISRTATCDPRGTSSKREAHCDCMALGGTRKAGRCACAVHVLPKSPEARQS